MLVEYLRIAFGVLRAHKFRSFLTVLSITIGAFSIVVMSSLAASGLASLAKGIEDLGGARLVSVWSKPPEKAERKAASYSAGMTLADWDAVFPELPYVLERSRFATPGRRDAIADSGARTRTDYVVGDGNVLNIFRMKIARGRGFTDEEDRRHARVCVIGAQLARKLWDGLDDAAVVGRLLTLGGSTSLRCQVIGVLVDEDRWGVNFGFDWKDVVFVPFETARDAEPLLASAMESLVKTDDQSHNEIVKRIVNARLAERHHGVDDFEMFDFSKIMDKWDQLFVVMRVIVGFIAGIALLVGGVGVMNMMLVSVSERVREIGVRKALGASPRDIAAQFLAEAIVLSGAGGAVGAFGGVGMTLAACALIRHFKPLWVTVVSTPAVIAALSVSAAIGVCFGFFPARRASRLDAIEAMRR